jgi:hypothetical protein
VADPKKTIARGLDRHEREKTLAPNPFAVFKGAPTNIAALKKIAAKVVGQRDRMTALASGILKDLENFRATKSIELADMGLARGENGAIKDTWGPENRSAELAKQVSSRARMGRKTSEDERIAIRRDLVALHSAVKATANTFSDPVSLLYSKTLDSDRRNVIAQNLMRQGPVAVGDAMRHALAIGDLELAAAALDRHDKLSDAERDNLGISKNDFAAHLVADDMAVAKRLSLVIEIAVDEAELINGEAEGKNMSRARVGLGVKLRSLAELPEPKETSAGSFEFTSQKKKQREKEATESDEEKAARLEEEGNAAMRKAMIDSGHGTMLEALGYGPNLADGSAGE